MVLKRIGLKFSTQNSLSNSARKYAVSLHQALKYDLKTNNGGTVQLFVV